ncbi:EpsG family protein [Providencia rettgeri]|uniref:EpsG family protein n=1 Tax=Providencia rettgeri TaxID=587 RepID=UPI002220D06F|nr:EpsG family protein [Providencia rettgeri]ELR5279293.1 EpsG family protein [Providencia rettgeri]ELU1436639.1 EpsG family protein [Providencia rettgeri]UYV41602.1 EpsG family protein [Providencia rettgeri]
MNHIYYNLLIFSSLLFCWLAQYTKTYSIRTLFLFSSWLIVIIFSTIRFDVGPDYMAYVQATNTIISQGEPSSQLDYWLFSLFSLTFQDLPYQYAYVIGLYFIITYTLIFYRSYKEGYIFLSLLIFFCFGFYFDTLDRIRQFLAISIFFFSFRFLQNKNLFYFVIFVIFGIVAHQSFVLVIPFYFFYKLKSNKNFLVITLLTILPLSYFGLFNNLISIFLNVLPVYADRYLSTIYTLSPDIGLGFLFRALVIIFCVYYTKDKFLSNLLFVGGLIHIISEGNLLINRTSAYFSILVIIALPPIIKNIKPRLIPTILTLALIVFFQGDINRNNFEYKTIFD